MDDGSSKKGDSMSENIDIDDLNGRILELSELNQALTMRCAGMRGQLVKKDNELTRLTRELRACQEREVASNELEAMRKQNGKDHKEQIPV